MNIEFTNNLLFLQTKNYFIYKTHINTQDLHCQIKRLTSQAFLVLIFNTNSVVMTSEGQGSAWHGKIVVTKLREELCDIISTERQYFYRAPNVKSEAEFLAAEWEAREARWGLWAGGRCGT